MNPKFGILGMLSFGELSLGSKNPMEKSVLYTHHPSLVVGSRVPVHFGHNVKSLENDNSYFDANLKIDQSIIF
jgi:hypothetical protein